LQSICGNLNCFDFKSKHEWLKGVLRNVIKTGYVRFSPRTTMTITALVIFVMPCKVVLKASDRISAAQLGQLSDRALLVQNDSKNPKGPGEEPASGKAGAHEGESLLPAETDNGESLLPAETDNGESLLPAETDNGESLLPADTPGGASLLPAGSGAAASALSDQGEITLQQSSGKDQTSAAAAHTTYLKWLAEEKAFPTAVTCANCHPDHFEEWSVSAHAYAQMSPIFNSMHATILKQTTGTNGDFCIRCHTQIGMQREEELFISNLKRHPASIEGITCVVCHRVDRNYGKVSGRTAIVEGDLLAKVYGPKGGKILKQALLDVDKYKIQSKDIDGPRPVHSDAIKFDAIATSGFCGTCHDVNLLNGFRLEEAFSQFKNTASNKRGETCQDCHMGVIPGMVKPKELRFASAGKGAQNEHLSLAELKKTGELDKNYRQAPAARVGEEREATPIRKRTNHMFAGPDYSIVHPGLFPHSRELKDFTYQSRISRTIAAIEAETTAQENPGSFDRRAAEAKGVELAKKYALADWLSFRWEDGWGTDAFEDTEKQRVRADKESSTAKGNAPATSYFARLPEQDLNAVIAAGWHDPNPSKWRKGARARRDARALLDKQFELLNRINVERHQIWRRGLQLGDFIITKNNDRGLAFKIQVLNATDGHGVPTGFDAERLVFLQVTVTSGNGDTVFESGDRDPNGDVRDLHSAYVHAGKLPIDKYLFNLQSKFLTRNNRGGEQEQVLAVNHSPDPLPYIRPDTRAGILLGRPAGARKQAKIIPPKRHRWASYEVGREKLSGTAPYRVEVKLIAQMVPVNLVKAIGDVGFDYNLSALEVAKRVVWGHRVSPSRQDRDRRGGALTIWSRSVTINEDFRTVSWLPTEAEIMAKPLDPFPVQPVEEDDETGKSNSDNKSTPNEELPGESLLPGTQNDGESLLPEGT
jgi:nitrate/TMAO reductase-like tetraheme cytochrome c subunit